MDPIEVQRMSAGELDAAGEVIGLAFADNPNTLAVMRGDRVKPRRAMQTVSPSRALRLSSAGIGGCYLMRVSVFRSRWQYRSSLRGWYMKVCWS
jgi:hypothetical protein